MSDKNSKSFQGNRNLDSANYGTKGLDGIGNLKPINSGGSGSNEIIPNGLDGISEIAPKPQSDPQSSSQGDKK